MKTPLTLCCMVLLLLGIACERVVEVELPPHESRIVANAFLSAGEPLRLYISRSVGIVDRTNPADRVIKDARVTILEDGQPFPARYIDTILIDTTGHVSYPPAHYYVPLLPVAGRNYELRVTHDGFDSVVAETRVPVQAPILVLQFVDNAFRSETGEPQFRLSITVADPPGVRNYYHLIATLVQIDSLNMVWTAETLRFSNTANLGKIAYDGSILFSDELIDGQTVQLDFYGALPAAIAGAPIDGRYPWELLQVDMRHTSRDYFEYQAALPAHQQAQEVGSGFFRIDPSPIVSNVKGGYGIFAGYASVCDTLFH